MELSDARRRVEAQFAGHFSRRGYVRCGPVEITSRVDPSVYLVNSATNLFKPLLNRENVCAFAVQRSMRTQILGDYYCEARETEYPTCFDSYGAYVSIEHLRKLLCDTIGFFRSLGFAQSQLRVRASYRDELLLRALWESALGGCVELDARAEKYDHTYGSSLTGRAIKIDCYQEWQKKHKNLCYVIVISENGIPKGAELATSDQLILMRLFHRQYAVSVAKIAELLPTDTFAQRRFADSVAGAGNLIGEGIRPNSSNTNGRTLKKYLRAVSEFGNALQIPPDERVNLLCAYIAREYGAAVDRERLLELCRRVWGAERSKG